MATRSQKNFVRPRPARVGPSRAGGAAVAAPGDVAVSYEKQLNANPRWALSEGSAFFEGKSKVQDTLRKITQRLNSLGIPYSIVGGLALFHHGHRRFTEDVDLLVTKEGLKRIHAELEGLGYVPPFAGSKHLRDTESGVKVEFLTTGDFPGDGKPKPVAFPEPLAASFEADGVRYLNLEKLVELKLASGMTNAGRLKDLSDVVELIKILNLPQHYAEKLHPYVREKYDELWQSARQRFVMPWRNKFLTVDAKSLDEMISSLHAAAEELEAMKRDGIVLDQEGGTADDYAMLVTSDPKIAQKYGMQEESELWGTEDQDRDADDTAPSDDSQPNNAETDTST
jgi:hypothetical protein